jgi:hypothetical protein
MSSNFVCFLPLSVVSTRVQFLQRELDKAFVADDFRENWNIFVRRLRRERKEQHSTK